MVSIPIRPVTRPPYDSELEIALSGLRDKVPSTITPQMIAGLRLPVDEPVLAETLRKHDAVARDIRIAGHKGGRDRRVGDREAGPDRSWSGVPAPSQRGDGHGQSL